MVDSLKKEEKNPEEPQRQFLWISLKAAGFYAGSDWRKIPL